MRVCIEQSTGRLIEAQSNDQAPLDTLLANALAAGYAAEAVEVKVVDEETYQALRNPAPTLDEAKSARIALARDACDAILEPLGAEYGVWERQSWDVQLAEANALLANPAASTPMLVAMVANIPGDTVAALAQRIVKNREDWSIISGRVIGQRLAIVKQINDATTVAEVNAIPIKISL